MLYIRCFYGNVISISLASHKQKNIIRLRVMSTPCEIINLFVARFLGNLNTQA